MDLFSDSESDRGSSSGESSTSLRSLPVDIIERSDEEGARGDDEGFRINKDYAAKFQHNNERADLHRLQEKFGRNTREADENSASSSDDESEDEEGEQLTADVDAAILTTLAKIRRKDESIYDVSKRVFEEERTLASKSKLLPRKLEARGAVSRDGKKVTLGQYQRERIQELLKTSDDPARALADATMIERRSDGINAYENESVGIAAMPYSHNKEQEELRREVTSAFHQMAGNGGADEDFFTAKKTEDQQIDTDGAIDDDPESYRRYLMDVLGGKEDELRTILRAHTGGAAALDSAASDMFEKERSKRNVNMHAKDQEKENEEFLTNYILNRGWMDNPHAAPTSSANQAATGADGQGEADDEDAASDASFESRAQAFEDAYNYRFQEMEEGEVDPQIQSYARRIEGSARRVENKRKREREERAKRKAEERAAKRSELDRMRDLKRKTIVESLKALKEATGSTAVNFDALDLDADFDPAEHDRLMDQAFNQDYYDDDGVDTKKPTWNDDIDISDILREEAEKEAKRNPKKAAALRAQQKESRKNAENESDDDGGQDVENDTAVVVSGKKLSKAEKKKLKKRDKAKARKAQENGGDGVIEADDMDADVVTFDAHENVGTMTRDERKRKMEQMMDEYYGLEYEDMIGDQPTRFKYTEVPRSDFGLTSEEILMADDAELNKVVGLKRLQPYRHAGRKGANRPPADLKARLNDFRRTFYKGDRSSTSQDVKPKHKKAGKRERERKKLAAASTLAATEAEAEAAEASTAVASETMNAAASSSSKKDKGKKRQGVEKDSSAKKHKRSKRERDVET